MKNRKGFTLVEIVIVILILGILAALTIPKFQERAAERRYSKVLEYLRSNHCVKMEYYEDKEEIYLVKEGSGGHGIFFELNNDSFFELKDALEKGGLMGTWTFESKDEAPAPGSVWYGIRKTEN